MADNFSASGRILQSYIKEAKRFPRLEREAEKKLIVQVKNGSLGAIHALVRANLLFVIKIAYKYRNQGMELTDLISAGNLGLIEAARRMDPHKDNKFITYAVWWIRQSIRYAIFNQSRMIRLASNKEEKLRALYRNKLATKSYVGGYAPDLQQAQEILGEEEKELWDLIQMMEAPLSFDAPRGSEEKGTLGDLLPDASQTPDEAFAEKELNTLISEATLQLEDREKKILSEYFGLGDGPHQSLSQIGEGIHLSKERVRQIKDDALTKIRDMIDHPEKQSPKNKHS